MHAVGDQFDGHPRVFEESDDRPGLAAIDRAHRVEQVRAHRRARVDRSPRLLVGRLGVPDGGHHARIEQLPDRGERAVAFRREGDHANGTSARSEDPVDLGGVRVAHQRRLVGAAPLGREPRALEVDSVDQTRSNVIGQFPYLAQQFGRVRGDQGSDECGGAVPAVQCHRG